jgi:hypothetical protein
VGPYRVEEERPEHIDGIVPSSYHMTLLIGVAE